MIRSEIYKCKTRQATDCEYFLAITFKDPCKFLSSDDDVWSPFMKSVTPRITCEAKKGVYVFKNGYLDFTKASQLNVFFQNYWRIHLEIFSNKKLVYCHLLDFEMVTLNRKNRRN
ncbi:uncharacterized protein LOC142331600 [Lycorma delicatula]|uniref:uncharacterized protein LOC142331600 n=1 Tax=Lycorma delicatula TaxID=130591 RepID=UPI003F51AA04